MRFKEGRKIESQRQVKGMVAIMFKKILFIIVSITMIIGLVGCNIAEDKETAHMEVAADTEATLVTLEGDTIVYSGDITIEGVEQVKSLYSPEVKKLIITSKSGDMYAGMDLGEFVFDNKLDVEVKDYVYSVAANYVITAANTLYLREDSAIGFNGGLSKVSRQAEKDEGEFFRKIGVQQQITDLGNGDSFRDKSQGSDGFTYTIDSLDKLGVTNVQLVDGSWQPITQGMFNLFTIERDEFYSKAYIDSEILSDQPPIEYTVTVEGNSIIYDGEVSALGLEEIKDLYNENINRLVINSPGGEINIGMDFGDFIFEKKLDVEVEELAFSSAANYIITAANTLYLHKDAVIGWHGGATQEMDIPEVQPGGEYYEYNQDSIKRETDFYKKIGVNQQINVYGQEEKFVERAAEIEAFGWTYTIDALKEAGVDDIQFIGETWVPNSELNYMGHEFNLLVIDDFTPSV